MDTSIFKEPENEPEPPPAHNVGRAGVWRLPLLSPADSRLVSDSGELRLSGTFIGFGSSHNDAHNHDAGAPKPGDRPCSACRWFESRLFRVTDGPDRERLGLYVVYNVGQSVVAGEQPRYSYTAARSPYEVIEVLTTVRSRDDGGVRRVLGNPARRMLGQAAFHDNHIRDAYEGRMEQL